MSSLASPGTPTSDAQRARRGLVIGKFWPPHLGHHDLIEEAQRRCERVVVVTCATEAQRPTGRERSLWLQAVHPRCEVVAVDDFCDPHFPAPCERACTAKWATRVAELGLGAIDVVVTSEPYGEAFAAALGARHSAFDPGRTRRPIRATDVRADLRAHWNSLHPIVRVGLQRRVVIVGAESTGTTTLAADLSRALRAPLTAEVGRTESWRLCAAVGSMERVRWTERDFWRIVDDQARIETLAAYSSVERTPGELGPWTVCDTDTLATVAWWERYLSAPSRPLYDFARARLGDLYLLTSPTGVEFEHDALRDGRALRLAMHERFAELLENCGQPWRLVEGDRASRLACALALLAEHEAQFPRFSR